MLASVNLKGNSLVLVWSSNESWWNSHVNSFFSIFTILIYAYFIFDSEGFHVNIFHDSRYVSHESRHLSSRSTSEIFPRRPRSSLAHCGLQVTKAINADWEQRMLEFNIQTHAVLLLTNMSVLTLLLLFTIPACNAIQLWYPPIFWHKDDCR